MATVPSIPGFSKEQVGGLITLFNTMIEEKLNQRFGSTQPPALPPAPQPIKKQEVEKLQPYVEKSKDNTMAITLKNLSYPDFFSFIDMLENVAYTYTIGQLITKSIIATTVLRDDEPQKWYTTLISRFMKHIAAIARRPCPIGFSAFKKFWFSEKPSIDSFCSGRKAPEGFLMVKIRHVQHLLRPLMLHKHAQLLDFDHTGYKI